MGESRDKKKLGEDLNSQVVDAFHSWADFNRFARRKAAEAALELIQRVPDALRAIVMRGEWKAVDEYLGRVECALMKDRITEKTKRPHANQSKVGRMGHGS